MLDLIDLKAKYNNYNREVKHEQLVSQFTYGRPKFYERIFTGLGDILFSIREKIQDRSHSKRSGTAWRGY